LFSGGDDFRADAVAGEKGDFVSHGISSNAE
jgi:hypothetical protein